MEATEIINGSVDWFLIRRLLQDEKFTEVSRIVDGWTDLAGLKIVVMIMAEVLERIAEK
jgi:hypothetical protein